MVKNILLVDDDKISNFINSKVLSRAGIVKEPHTAMNGKEALEHINKSGTKWSPDVIFVDLNMPVMDGFQFIEAFSKLDHSKTDKVKIVIVTSSEDPEDMKRALSLGVTDYLVKPMKEEDILRILNYN
jgi:CheY-like chemotaxis protein